MFKVHVWTVLTWVHSPDIQRVPLCTVFFTGVYSPDMSWVPVYTVLTGVYSPGMFMLQVWTVLTWVHSPDILRVPVCTVFSQEFTLQTCSGFRYVQFWQEFTFYTGISLFSESLMFKLTNSYPPWVATSLPNIQTNLIKLLIFFRDHFQTWQNSQKILTVRWGQIWIQEKKRSAVFGDNWLWYEVNVTKFI